VTCEDLAAMFFETIGNSNESIELFLKSNIPKTAISELLYVDTFCGVQNKTISSFRNLYQGTAFDLADHFIEQTLSILREMNAAKSDSIKILAELHISQFQIDTSENVPPLINPTSTYCSYIDLASGPDFINYFAKFDKDIHYYTIDSSYFVHECLSQYATKTNTTNFSSINLGIEKSQKPFGSRVMAVRSKNIGGYVGSENGFEFITKTAKWLERGGIFIFHEYATSLGFEQFRKNSKTIADHTGCAIGELISGDPSNKYSVHTAKLIRKIDAEQ
jgi:hypothetical protein